ncbi:unnamed protein product [Allacma fusca]|uniref:Mediator of RNA polymerase II transcription subunit 15 n=1 Tax=Allacma fusca TaxID=39272 RepID=A0A8J2M6N1_9HEXA|nr:unnamed protein product [Allacma fusca]
MKFITPLELLDSPNRWRFMSYRKQIVSAIEHAITYCPHPLLETAYDMERRAFEESENKEQYLKKVRRTIISIDKKTFPDVFMRRNRDWNNMSCNVDQGNPGPSTSGTHRFSNNHQDLKCLIIRADRIIKSKELVLKSQNYLRKRRQSPLQNASALKKKKLVLSRFRMHRYLSTLITQEQERIVNNINAKPVEPDADSSLQNVQEMGDTWKSKLCSFFVGLQELDKEPTIPHYVCDPLTNAVLSDPVVAPSGVSYEKSQIEDYMNRVEFDTVPEDKVLIPNYALKEVVDDFLSENEWAQTSVESE